MAVSASLNVQWRTNSRRWVGGSNSAAIWASVSCCRRISRVSPEVKTGRPADPGQGVDERAAPDAKDAPNRGLHGAAVDAGLDTHPWRDVGKQGRVAPFERAQPVPDGQGMSSEPLVFTNGP